MRRITGILLMLAVLSWQGCGLGEWEMTGLYAQKIEGTSKVLYKYSAWGGRDSHAFGFVLLDSTETFRVDVSRNLTFMHLWGIPRRTLVKGVSFRVDDGSSGANYDKTAAIFTPIWEEQTEGEGIRVVDQVYQYKGFSERVRGLGRFQFERFRETRDSLFFYNLDDVESANSQHLDSLKIGKGEVILDQDKDGRVVRVTVEDLVFAENSGEIVAGRTYFLTPKQRISPDAFSDYGIFKEVTRFQK